MENLTENDLEEAIELINQVQDNQDYGKSKYAEKDKPYLNFAKQLYEKIIKNDRRDSIEVTIPAEISGTGKEIKGVAFISPELRVPGEEEPKEPAKYESVTVGFETGKGKFTEQYYGYRRGSGILDSVATRESEQLWDVDKSDEMLKNYENLSKEEREKIDREFERENVRTRTNYFDKKGNRVGRTEENFYTNPSQRNADGSNIQSVSATSILYDKNSNPEVIAFGRNPNIRAKNMDGFSLGSEPVAESLTYAKNGIETRIKIDPDSKEAVIDMKPLTGDTRVPTREVIKTGSREGNEKLIAERIARDLSKDQLSRLQELNMDLYAGDGGFGALIYDALEIQKAGGQEQGLDKGRGR